MTTHTRHRSYPGYSFIEQRHGSPVPRTGVSLYNSFSKVRNLRSTYETLSKQFVPEIQVAGTAAPFPRQTAGFLLCQCIATLHHENDRDGRIVTDPHVCLRKWGSDLRVAKTPHVAAAAPAEKILRSSPSLVLATTSYPTITRTKQSQQRQSPLSQSAPTGRNSDFSFRAGERDGLGDGICQAKHRLPTECSQDQSKMKRA
eukprot:3446603-Rhodomonas_salina.1